MDGAPRVVVGKVGVAVAPRLAVVVLGAAVVAGALRRVVELVVDEVVVVRIGVLTAGSGDAGRTSR